MPQNDTLISLVYISHAAEAFGPASLVELLHESRANNDRLGITGFLVYRHQTFIQILEGREQTVRDLYERIMRDPRHADIRVVLDEQTPARRFEQWSMGHEPVMPGTTDAARVDAATAELAATEGRDTAAAVDALGAWFTERARRDA